MNGKIAVTMGPCKILRTKPGAKDPISYCRNCGHGPLAISIKLNEPCTVTCYKCGHKRNIKAEDLAE